MKKHIIRICAINAPHALEGADVARASRDGRIVTLRHAWHNEDGRAISAVMSVARELARECVRRCDRDVTIVDRAGHPLDVVYAD